MPARRRRAAAWLSAPLLVAMALPLLSACGGGGQISVTLTPDSGGQTSFKPGDTATFVVTAANNGPGDAPGVNLMVGMPSGFRYKATDSIDDGGSARTQPLDARVGSSEPEWGFWDIAAPTPGSSAPSVSIRFSVDIEATPNSYNIAGRGEGDNTSGAVLSKALIVQVTPSPRLGLSARVDTPTTTMLKAGSTATYRVTITNTGSDTASSVSLLVALPPVMVFQSSVTPLAGNASRNQPVDPVKGSVEVFYGGYTLPAASTGGPGFIVIAFKVVVVARPAAGKYAINAQVTDSVGDLVDIDNVAPVSVQASPSPSPTLFPAASPSPSPSPQH